VICIIKNNPPGSSWSQHDNKDLDFLTMAFKNDEFCHSTHYFDYVRLLMEDLRSDDALAVLNSQRIDDEEITDNIIWNELFIQA
jgi:hypothetical protein